MAENSALFSNLTTRVGSGPRSSHSSFPMEGIFFIVPWLEVKNPGKRQSMSLDSKETSRLTSVDSNVTFVPPGFLLFGRQGTLLAQPFDLRKLRLIGEPVPVAAEHVARWPRPPASSLFSASQNGVLVYLNETSPNIQLAWYKRDGARLGSIGEPGPNEGMRISPDETQLVLDRADPQTGLNDVWTLQLSSGIFTRVTFGPGNNIGPEWSPDGNEVAFSSDRRASGLYD